MSYPYERLIHGQCIGSGTENVAMWISIWTLGMSHVCDCFHGIQRNRNPKLETWLNNNLKLLPFYFCITRPNNCSQHFRVSALQSINALSCPVYHTHTKRHSTRSLSSSLNTWMSLKTEDILTWYLKYLSIQIKSNNKCYDCGVIPGIWRQKEPWQFNEYRD